jgi:uncharacterized protein
MMSNFLFDGDDTADKTIILAHGAGAPMDAGSMTDIAHSLALSGFRVARFEFSYMAGRRTSAGRKPPPRAESLVPEYLAALEALGTRGPIFIGGKSMGGRVASMIADELHASGKIAGLLCLGYPFHPVGKPAQHRTAHLARIKTPTLIVQGTRDQFGNQDEVAGYELSDEIEILWLEDGDHDFGPCKSMSGFVVADHLATLAARAAAWADSLKDRPYGLTQHKLR